MLELGKGRQIYEFTTDQGDFNLFAKYRSVPTTSKEGYTSWSFVFTANDIEKLENFIASEKHLSVGLVCGDTPLSASHLAFLHKNELQELFSAGKNSFTISHRKGEHSYKIYMGGSRDNCQKVGCNRSF